MPSHKVPVKRWDYYTVAPIIIFQIQSYARFTAIESNVFTYIVLGSINVYGKGLSSDARQWFYISPTEFANDRGHSRQGVSDALNKLVKNGFLNVRDVQVKTAGGYQKSREYMLVSNEKLLEIFELLSTSANPQGCKSDLHPLNQEKNKGCKSHLTRVQARLDKGAGQACHLVRPGLHPWGVNQSKSLGNLVGKDSLNTIKDFLKTILEFQNSFYELHSLSLKSKASVSKLEMKIASLIRLYGLFSTYTAMLVCLFNKDAQMGNVDLVETFLKTNSEKFKDHEQNLILQCDNLFHSIFQLYQDLSNSDIELESFMETFRQKASLLLITSELELRSRGIFFYSDFHKDIIDTFLETKFSVNLFTKEWISKKLNLYFKAKLLGHKGLNYVQS